MRALSSCNALRRRGVFVVIAIILCLLILVPSYHCNASIEISAGKRAPTWRWLKDWERHLPQHDLKLPYPEGSTGRYVRFSVQSQRLGWNNFITELLMNTHLAHESGRGSVFPEYAWDVAHYPFPSSEAHEWPPHTPLNALVSGPAVGGPWEWNDKTPRAISSTYFDIVCPPSERRYLNSTFMREGRSWLQGNEMFQQYAEILRDAPERCIDVVQDPKDNIPQLFDMWLWGEPRVLSLWESFSKSPTSRLLGASPLVKSALDRNTYLFVPRGPRPTLPSGTGTFDRTLALHLRRGDYDKACKHLTQYSSLFNGWNQLEFLPDRLSIPQGDTEKAEEYRRRCSPTFDEIMMKIKQARDSYDGALDMLYLLTNEKGQWLDDLVSALRKAGWSTIVTSRDLELVTSEEEEIAMIVDMEIARQAAMFIGNGWSSYTSSVVHRRLVDGKPPASIRFY